MKVFKNVYVYVYIYMCVCVCVCVNLYFAMLRYTIWRLQFQLYVSTPLSERFWRRLFRFWHISRPNMSHLFSLFHFLKQETFKNLVIFFKISFIKHSKRMWNLWAEKISKGLKCHLCVAEIWKVSSFIFIKRTCFRSCICTYNSYVLF